MTFKRSQVRTPGSASTHHWNILKIGILKNIWSDSLTLLDITSNQATLTSHCAAFGSETFLRNDPPWRDQYKGLLTLVQSSVSMRLEAFFVDCNWGQNFSVHTHKIDVVYILGGWLFSQMPMVDHHFPNSNVHSLEHITPKVLNSILWLAQFIAPWLPVGTRECGYSMILISP